MFEFNGETWYIKFTYPNDSIFLMNDYTYTIGTCDDYTKTIYLADTLRGAMLKKVLCHEIVHAAMFSYNVELSIEQEELIANIIATYGEEILDITNKIFKKLRY